MLSMSHTMFVTITINIHETDNVMAGDDTKSDAPSGTSSTASNGVSHFLIQSLGLVNLVLIYASVIVVIIVG